MPDKSRSPLEWVVLLLRFAFGGLFVYTSIYHALHAAKLLQSIKDYAILPGALIPWSGFLLIACEAGIGVALFFGFAARQAAIASTALLLVFTGAMVSAKVRGLDIACGCGLGDTQVSWWDVARDIVLIAVAVFLAWRSGKVSSMAEQPARELSTARRA